MRIFHWIRFGCLLLACPLFVSHGQTLYEFGNPGPEEQLYIELINRARADPAAEGARMAATQDADVLSAYQFYGVDLALMEQEFADLPVQPPLAPHAALTSAARGHSDWMLANAEQTHTQTNPTKTAADRATEAGYPFSVLAENVYAYAKSVWYGHAGFQVDWGPGTSDGMQVGRGHRINIHHGSVREIGVGVTLGSNGPVGPQVVTQKFGARFGMPSLGTGVAYYDLNSNGAYDIGEGIAGLTVHLTDSGHYCVTAAAGGWVVPGPTTAGTRTATFTGLGIHETRELSFPANTNAKADLALPYQAPQFTGPAEATAGQPHPVSFQAVGGATAYRWTRWIATAAEPEPCENTTGITSSTTGTYSVLSTAVKYQGNAAFTLKNPNGNRQWIELKGLYFGGNTPALTYRSRIRLSSSDESFKVQIRDETAGNWQDVDSQAGYNGSGESVFNLRPVDLAPVSGKRFRIRFLLEFQSGSYYLSDPDSAGWFIDDIVFTDVRMLDGETTEILASNSGSFIPDEEEYLMMVNPVISGRDFPPSYRILTATAGTPATFAGWAAAIEAEHDLPPGTIGDHPDADFDHDGRANLVEYAFGTSPVAADSGSPGPMTIIEDSTRFIVRYPRDTARADVSIVPLASVDGQAWHAPGESGAPDGFIDEFISAADGTETREASFPRHASGTGMIRLRVSLQ